ncbi:MAG: Na+/H+ antiporter NhaC family protein [Candidatus Palauibacterales bacterium]|nr:Na+/H+ antiporter NhaC family protein [Candidatus Palauibacterales bacterium]MDP2483955.1 Na+/H+ antiporter NhaC family protein [Candidatus Palauibacterales bacterium]
MLAIGLAIYTRQVYLSLAAGIWIGWTIILGWNPIAGLGGAVEATVNTVTDPGNARVLMFTFAIGALIALVEANGGVRGFVRWVEERQWVDDGRKAQVLAWVIGVVIFIESNITVLVAGSICRPLFDRYRVSREKLAYLVDSTSAPVCILIPFNAWGAYILGVLATLGVREPVSVLVASIPLNFYALAALAIAGFSAFRQVDIGPMKAAQRRTAEGMLHWEHSVALADPEDMAPPPREGMPLRPANMIVPIVVMVAMMPVSMYVTGNGDLMAGSGSTSVLWAVLTAIGVAWLLSLGQRLLDLEALSRASLKGAGALTGMALVLLFAITLAAVTVEMGTGEYVAGIVGGRVPLPVLLPLLFLVAGGIAFATGSSWGTFGIMLPMAVPLAATLGLSATPFIAAVLSGGVFGDHASPISDTTIISSLASASDHIEHVRTQIPYALLAGAAAIVGFALTGTWMTL